MSAEKWRSVVLKHQVTKEIQLLAVLSPRALELLYFLDNPPRFLLEKRRR